MSNTTIVPEAPCPHCGAMADRATDVEGGAQPEPGDYSLCTTCGNVSKFTEGMGRERIPQEEQNTWSPEFRNYIERNRRYLSTLQ